MKINVNLEEIENLDALPSPSGVAAAILELTQKEDATSRSISDVVKKDPTLAGRLLKFSNSSAIGFSRPVASVHDAVVILGVNIVSQLALGLSVLSNSLNGPCRNFDYEAFWSRSLATALAAQIICVKDGSFSPEEVFTCGLLNRIGSLALASLFPAEYEKVLATIDSTHANIEDLCNCEHQYFDTDHIAFSSELAKDWGIPKIHTDAMSYSCNYKEIDNIKDKRTRSLAYILHLSSILGNLVISDDKQTISLMPGLLALAEKQNINQDELRIVYTKLVTQWQEWGAFLDLPTHAKQKYDELLERTREVKSEKKISKLQSLRILVVDDDPMSLRMLEKLLTQSGHNVSTATNGKEGLLACLKTRPQLVITDWKMPEMDGIAFCRALRETRFGKLLYIIMVTMHYDEDHLVKAFEAGIDDYVPKPINSTILEARIIAAKRLINLQTEINVKESQNQEHIAKLKIANREIKNERNRIQQYMQIANVIFLVIDNNLDITLINRKGCEVIGYPEQELVGRKWTEYFVSKDIREELNREFSSVFSGNTELLNYFETNTSDSQGYSHTIAWHNTLLHNQDNSINSILCYGEDITEFRNNAKQRQLLQNQLIQAQKMESIGQLTAGIAHDFNNIMTAILGYSELSTAKAQVLSDPKLVGYLREVTTSVSRAKTLVEKLLLFSRQTQSNPVPLNLKDEIENIYAMLRGIIPKNIVITKNYEENIPKILFDPVSLQQVILNLCINAYDALGNSGTITIGIRKVKITKTECTSCHDSLSGNFIELYVKDNGPGIPVSKLSNIFEPFFSTKEFGKGSGMGLAIVHGVVHHHNSHIVVKTKEGQGTAFHILFNFAG